MPLANDGGPSVITLPSMRCNLSHPLDVNNLFGVIANTTNLPLLEQLEGIIRERIDLLKRGPLPTAPKPDGVEVHRRTGNEW